MKNFKVTGVGILPNGMKIKINQQVAAEDGQSAIALVNVDLLKESKLFLSARVEEVAG